MESTPPKAESVREDGSPDGWRLPRSWRPQVAPDGSTRLVVYVPPAELPDMHLRLLRAMGGPFSIAYTQLTDRAAGRTHPKPIRWVGLELPTERALAAIRAAGDLVWFDGRHQFWARGPLGEQVILDELGVLYCYPDDPSFRDALDNLPQSPATGMDGRDYVKVNFRADADAQEAAMIAGLNLQRIGE